jgi:uncharacterized protein YbaP (TraB family)
MSPMRRLAIVAGLASWALAMPVAWAGSPSVWAVAGAGNTVYLFGSVHLLQPGDFVLQGAPLAAYEDAAAVYLEVDMDDLSPSELAAATTSRAVDPQGRTLEQLMGGDAALARERAAKAGIDLSTLDHLEPWFAGLAVVPMALSRDGYTADAGVEKVVQDRAAADGKEILGLETLDQQLAALDSMELGVQREFLLKALDDAQQPADALQRFLRSWQEGDDEALAAELATQSADMPDLYRSLMVERNRSWAAKISGLLGDSRDYLVVVGALHLVGPDGLPRMLQARGLSVTRMEADPAH